MTVEDTINLTAKVLCAGREVDDCPRRHRRPAGCRVSEIPKWQASIQYLYPGEATSGRMAVYLADDVDAAIDAAEQRVFAFHPEWTVTGMCEPDCLACRRLDELINERAAGYKAGLDAARDAVAALPWSSETWQAHDERAAALAAIDALRGAE